MSANEFIGQRGTKFMEMYCIEEFFNFIKECMNINALKSFISRKSRKIIYCLKSYVNENEFICSLEYC